MGVHVILPESMLTMAVNNTITNVIDDDGASLSEMIETPLATVFPRDASSVADSVDLLIERNPLLFNPHAEEEDGNDDEDDLDDESDSDWFCDTEILLPLNDTGNETSRISAAASKPDATPSLRRQRFASSPFDDSFDGYPADQYDELDDFDDDEDSIDFPTFHFSEPVPPPAVVAVSRTSPCA